MSALGAGVRAGDRYAIERELASGAMGSVFYARDERDGRAVAVKTIRASAVDDKLRQRFSVEAEATRRLVHENIVAVLDFGLHEGAPYLVLELLEGQTLADALQSRGRMPWRDGVQVLLGIARALDVAHTAQVIHRDLKPNNVFLTARNSVAKVLDFGIAKILDDSGPRVHTSTGIVLGTPGYVAPERMRAVEGDPRSDLYALGALAWDVLANRRPFAAKTDVLLSLKHMAEPAPHILTFVDDVPEDLDALVGALLLKDPALRPQTAAAVSERLDAIAHG